MRAILILAFGLFIIGSVHAQVGSSISSDGTAPNVNAILDVQSPATGSGKGMLIPRVTLAQRTTTSASLAGGLLDDSGNLRGGPAHGLIVYQTDAIQGLYFNTSQTATPSWALLGMDDSSVSIGRAANGSASGVAVGSGANGYNECVAVGNAANGTSEGVAVGFDANGYSSAAALGYSANGYNTGVALGWLADGNSSGAAMGFQAMGANNGVAVGYQANGSGGVAVGRLANGSFSGMAIGANANGYYIGAAAGYGAVGTNYGAAMGFNANGSVSGAVVGASANGALWGAAIGARANGYSYGAAVGNAANGYSSGAAVGYLSSGINQGAALGRSANGDGGAAVGYLAKGWSGAAVGAQASGTNSGVAIGSSANGSSYGAAVGAQANGFTEGAGVGATANGYNMGVAVGYGAEGRDSGVAMGHSANGARTNIAIGVDTDVQGGTERIAIGHAVQNDMDNTTRIRGTLYLDGGTGVVCRSGFGGGVWTAKAFEIDHPLDPENKILRHFCMEGPQVWNVYAGNAKLVNGQATVQLPDYYSALNLVGSEIYGLTVVGTLAQIAVGTEVNGNQFTIIGDKDVKVSWTIKVLRNDPGCLEDLRRRPVEQLKRDLAR